MFPPINCVDFNSNGNDKKMTQSHDDRAQPAPILDSYEAYGCKVNQIDVDELFRRYEQTGFLYPAKMQRLAPYLSIIKENWRKALRSGELIHWVATYDDRNNDSWATVSSWRTTNTGWASQHLTSNGSPIAARAVMLGGSAVRIRNGMDASDQNWFQRNNRYANKIFGSLTETLAVQDAWIGDYSYYFMPLGIPPSSTHTIHVERADHASSTEIHQFVTASRSPVYAEAEGFMDADLELELVDALYRRVRLRRFRHIYVARDRTTSQIVGLASAYRGPLGLNFSFLENRCDIVLARTLPPADAIDISSSLFAAVTPTYGDFELQKIPTVIDTRHAPTLAALSGEFIRDYAQGIWLQPGYEQWYRHTERFFDRIVHAERFRGLGSGKQVEHAS